jgi:hypothetical protein
VIEKFWENARRAAVRDGFGRGSRLIGQQTYLADARHHAAWTAISARQHSCIPAGCDVARWGSKSRDILVASDGAGVASACRSDDGQSGALPSKRIGECRIPHVAGVGWLGVVAGAVP